MPTITTTVTSAETSGLTTTVTTTEASPDPTPPTVAPATSTAQPEEAKVRPPKEEHEITCEWLTAALHERGHLPKQVTVAAMKPLKNCGEGRGYANYSWKIEVTYDGPVSPEIPTMFVLKQMNQSFAPNFPVGEVRRIADKSYTLEAWWYDNIRDRLPIPQPKCYWAGSESSPDTSAVFGQYGVLMGWLGDDLVKAPQNEGVTEWQNKSACTELAKLHAAFWNSKELDDVPELMSPDEMVTLMYSFMGGADTAVAYADTQYREWYGDKFADYAKAAMADIGAWNFKGVSDNKALCSWDLRTDNMVWRKVHPKLDEYECVIIDHQLWMWGGSPAYDLCNYLCCSCTPEQMPERVATGLKVYHETLLANGVTTYSWEDLNKDFDNAIWHAISLATFGGKMTEDTRAAALANPEGSSERAEGLQMVENMISLFQMVSDRVAFLVDHRNAWDPTFLKVPGYNA